jgi:SAM-dependent methyltransferase
MHIIDSFLDYIFVLHTGVHWTPRENAFCRAITKIRSKHHINKVVDVGCGHALLYPAIKRLGLSYTGADISMQLLERARAKYPEAEFILSSAESLPLTIGPQDIVVLNGVVHHLDDTTLSKLLSDCQNCLGLIVLDHRRDKEFLNRPMILPRFLQWADRGSYVRPYSFFDNLNGFTRKATENFEISILGIRAWPYFCNVYEPKH